MIEATFTFGIVIFAGMALLVGAMPPWMRRGLLRHHLFTSLLVTMIALAIHWGTMTGLMAATVCGMMTSLACFVGRWYWRIT